MAKPPRSNRSRDETRDLMLEAGAQLVYEAFGAPADADWAPLAHVRLTDVAARASDIAEAETPITTGAIYPIWTDQNEYRRDLILHLLSPQQVRNQEFWAEFTDLLTSPDRPETIEETTELIAKLDFAAVVADPYYFLLYAVIPYCDDPVIGEATRKYVLAEQTDLLRFYRFGLMAFGRKIKPNFTEADVSRSLSALFDGMVLAHLSNPDQDGYDGLDLPDLLTQAATAILLAFSEPIDS